MFANVATCQRRLRANSALVTDAYVAALLCRASFSTAKPER